MTRAGSTVRDDSIKHCLWQDRVRPVAMTLTVVGAQAAKRASQGVASQASLDGRHVSIPRKSLGEACRYAKPQT